MKINKRELLQIIFGVTKFFCNIFSFVFVFSFVFHTAELVVIKYFLPDEVPIGLFGGWILAIALGIHTMKVFNMSVWRYLQDVMLPLRVVEMPVKTKEVKVCQK